MLRALKHFPLALLMLMVSASAQDVPTDQEFRKDVEKAVPDAKAFARSLEDAIAEAMAEAETIAASAERRAGEGQRVSPGVIDLDALLEEHSAAAAEAVPGGSKALPFLAFISLSMPPESLKPLLEDVHAAGGVAVLRGFKDGSVQKTAAALRDLTGRSEPLMGAIVDPRLFRSFKVEAVPTFIIPNGALGICDTPNCVEPAPRHDRIAGNVTVRFALERLAADGTAAPLKADVHLSLLAGAP